LVVVGPVGWEIDASGWLIYLNIVYGGINHHLCLNIIPWRWV